MRGGACLVDYKEGGGWGCARRWLAMVCGVVNAKGDGVKAFSSIG